MALLWIIYIVVGIFLDYDRAIVSGQWTTRAGWSEWAVAIDCTVTCGGGHLIMQRVCTDFVDNGGKNCNGKPTDLRTSPCNEQLCDGTCSNNMSYALCTWGDWEPWTPCSKSCDVGYRTRKRVQHGECYCQFNKDNVWEVCESEACPHWGEWEEWGYCKSTCFPDRFSGVRSRKRECVKDEKHTALCDISHVDADNNTCGPTYDSCMMQNSTCSVIMNQCGPVTAPVVTVAVATIQYAVNLVGSLCIIGVCAFLIAVFSLVKGLSVHRILHALEELSLILGHLCLCFMGEAVKEESSCELVTIAVNWAFLVYFTLLTIECFHVMTFIGHIIRYGAIIHPAILYAIGLLFPVMISIIMWVCFGDKMIVTIAGVRRLCWIDTCQDEDTNCASLDNYAARMFFCIYTCLCCASVVFVECGHSLSRIYPYRLYGTDLMLLRDAQFAHNGLYIMITVSYLAFACSIAAFQYQARDPHNALVYVWSTAATCLDVVLAFILLFYHSFGNAKVRRVIGNILRCSYCSRTRYKQNNDRNIPSSTLTD